MLALKTPRGDTLKWTFTLGVDVTGWTPKWTAKAIDGWASAVDGSAVLSATTGAGLTLTTPASGVIDLVITGAATSALLPGMYVWDLQLTKAAEVRTVRFDGSPYGTLEVEADVTRT